MSNPTVRLATAKDTTDLIRLVAEAHVEERLGPVSSLSEQRVFQTILQALGGDGIIGVVGDRPIESATFLSIARPWYSDAQLINCLLTYSRSDFRKTSNTKRLLQWAKASAERLGIPIQAESPAGVKADLCARVFGEPSGLSWFYEPRPDTPTEVGDVEIQPGSPDDEQAVIGVARELAKENGAHQAAEDIAISMLRSALEGDGAIGLIRGDKEVQSAIFLRIARPFYSNSCFLDEMFLFTRPQFRKSHNSRALLQFARRQADRLNVPLRIGIISKTEMARKRALYERLLGHEPDRIHFSFTGA